ncbi:MAG: DUF1501 domain-containing protein [Bryobacteraceae bacterium]|nr:DUF1501 domain-containing protein [Bryobacteraceae bacterium]
MQFTRRDALRTFGAGFGMLGVAQAANQPHFAAKAKHVIYLFLNGGPSQVDTFDPKPLLTKYHGQGIPEEFLKNAKKGKDMRNARLLGSPWQFKPYGQSGLEVSELFPKLGACIDDVCVIRSMHTDLPSHEQAITQMNSGRLIAGHPSMGSWITYGLGTENQNLPGFIALCAGTPHVGPQLWSNGYLPSAYQGTYVPTDESDPEKMIQNLTNRRITRPEQRRQLDLVGALNRLDLERRGQDTNLEGRIAAMETAFSMQVEALDAFDVRKETAAVRERYGIPDQIAESTSKRRSATRDGDFARGCLVARRLVERGVRVVQVYFGEDIPWDSHHDILVHRDLARQADQPIAALLTDLKQSGLLKDTIVVIGGEFGRTPSVETSGRINVQNGRDHNSDGFTYLLAGGGFKGGTAYGATDEFGFAATENKVHLHDLHATILHQLGLDHKRLTYRYSGRDFRLTDVAGNVVHGVLS